MARRLVPLALSISMVVAVGFLPTRSALAQDTKKALMKVEAPKVEPAKAVPTKAETIKKDEAAKPAPEKAVEPAPPAIPKEVEEKLEKARHAVAEAIVAAQDAGLVDTSIDPPPILDILIKGYAFDAKTLKNPAAKKTFWAVSPEVFCGWFTGYGKLDGSTINPMLDIRIINPSAGLKEWYDQRNILNKHIDAVRKAKGPAPTAKPAETKPAVAKPAETKPAAPAAPAPVEAKKK